MNIFQVAYKNLWRRKTRTLFTLIGIALSTWVLVTLLGFNKGYEQSLNENIEGMGFQIVLTAKGCPYEAATLMLKGGTGLRYMPEALVRDVAQKTEVAAAAEMLMHAEFDPNKGESGGTIVYLGIDPATYSPMKPYLQFAQGDWFASAAAGEVVLGYEAAELEQREVGDLMLLPGSTQEYKVSGILKRTGTQDDGMIFLPLQAAQKVFDKAGLLTMLGLRLKPEADQTVFEEELYQLPDVQVVSMAQVKNTILSLVASAKVIVLSIAFIAFLIAMFGVLNTVLMSVFERFQEIGILKSMGALPQNVFQMILIETTLLCALGSLAGISFALGFSSLSETAIRQLLPFTPNGRLIIIGWPVIIFSFVSITLVGIVGGVYPSLRAAAIRPLDSIRSEE
ncbi:macrolide ABC transporter permease protein [Candidatus Termititenax persephonae]|uniref:Macrolide ABC transporter permease protein n=1 Tax=Candidatus Termititenax persephonae TaxID=2218525 RepID=A0A388TI48_9BACT|nr:macrolide ABC transporter permease protein [Candidatus Termititenax persephonae]